jgi:hypothetical protein
VGDILCDFAPESDSSQNPLAEEYHSEMSPGRVWRQAADSASGKLITAVIIEHVANVFEESCLLLA